MDEDALYQLILRTLAEQTASLGGGMPHRSGQWVETPWGPVFLEDPMVAGADQSIGDGMGSAIGDYVVDPNTYLYEDWDQTGVASQWENTGQMQPWAATGADLATYEMAPPPDSRVLGDPYAGDVMANLQYGLEQRQSDPVELGRGLGAALSEILGRTEKPKRTNPSTARNTRPASTPGRGIAQAMQTSVAQPRTVPAYQRPAAQPIQHYATPRSSAAQSLRSLLPGLATARNSSRSR